MIPHISMAQPVADCARKESTTGAQPPFVLRAAVQSETQEAGTHEHKSVYARSRVRSREGRDPVRQGLDKLLDQEGKRVTPEEYVEGREQPLEVAGGEQEKRSKRLFDLLLAWLLLPLLLPGMAVIAALIKLTSKGPALYWSDRIGRDNTIFRMPKFRTMRLGTPAVATHLLPDAERYVTPVGSVLRKTSLDELPQLFSVLAGHMSFVGPRPALFNQDDLVALRTERGVHHLVPGVTGWAQVNGRDELPFPVKVEYDEEYLRHRSFSFDLKILFLTAVRVLRGEGVSH